MRLHRLTSSPRRGPFARPKPVMRGPYLVAHPLKALALAMLDALLALAPTRRGRTGNAPPQRILVADWAHLGDVVTTRGAITAIRARYPTARIGMIAASWGRAAVPTEGLVDEIHVIDPPGLNRSSRSRWAKWRQYRQTRRAALGAIRAADYQLGIDFYPYPLPAHPLFWWAGIPCRVGFRSGGFGALLTRPVDWPNADRPMAVQYGALLEAAFPGETFAPADLRPRLGPAPAAPLPPGLAEGCYVVLHPGTGAGHRQWGVAHWARLIELLAASSATRALTLVLTGAGDAEVATTRALAGAGVSAINLAGQLGWDQFLAVLAGAAAIVSPDTVTSHLGAMADTPLVTLFTGTNNPHQWGPFSDHAEVVVQDVRCAPCNRRACAVLACIRDTTPEDVLALVEGLLAGARG